MALRWDWKDKCGEAVVRQNGEEYTVNLYQGNALLIFLYEWEEDDKRMYSLWSFWADREHARALLGLSSKTKTTNSYTAYESQVIKFRLDKSMKDFAYIISLITRAFENVTIEVYTKGEEK